MAREESSTNTDSGTFFNESVFDPSHTPEQFRYRDAERAVLRSVLSPAVRSGATACFLVCGPRAGGKRTAIDLAIDALESAEDALSVQRATVNCDLDGTAYRLAIAASNALPGEDSLAESGYSRETAFRRLRGRLRDVDGVPILRLDHVQRVDPEELEALLAGLLHGTQAVPGAVVAVTDSLDYRNELAVDTRTRFDQEIYFGPYDTSQRESIVRDRASAAFDPAGCPDDVLDRCLEFAASTDAPLSTAFDVLELAGRRGADSGADALTIDHVEDATDVVQRRRLRAAIERCSTQERRTLAALLDAEEPRFGPIYESYRRHCRTDGVTPNRERSVHNYLDALSDAGLIETSEGRSSAGGRYFEYELVHDPDAVRAALSAVETDDSKEQ